MSLTTKLICNFKKCIYNHGNGYCSRAAISIAEDDSRNNVYTICESCKYKKNPSCNSTERKNYQTKIYCEAKFCVYQKNGRCWKTETTIEENNNEPFCYSLNDYAREIL